MDQLKTVDEFYLYGSTSKIDTITSEDLSIFDENSDYDFAVQDSAATEGELFGNGWVKKDDLDYQDDMTVSVYERVLDGHKVQVSLRNDLKTFKEVWNSVPYEFYWRFINKRAPMFIGKEGVKLYLNQLNSVAKGYYKIKSSVAPTKVYKRAIEDLVWVNNLGEVRPAPAVNQRDLVQQVWVQV